MYSVACSYTGNGQTFMGLQNQGQDQRTNIHRMNNTTQGQSGAVRGSQGQSVAHVCITSFLNIPLRKKSTTSLKHHLKCADVRADAESSV